MDQEILALAQTLWEYHQMHQQAEKSDLIMVLWSQDLRVADRGIELYKAGYAPRILFSWGQGRYTSTDQNFTGTTEADIFAARAIAAGIPAENIIIENTSISTWHNIQNSYELIKDAHIKSIILVQKPYMERRTFATFMKQRPDPTMDVCVTSPHISFADYPTPDLPLEKVINIMVGDLQRIIDYPAKWFQIPQEVPEEVMQAYERLIEAGFRESLL